MRRDAPSSNRDIRQVRPAVRHHRISSSANGRSVWLKRFLNDVRELAYHSRAWRYIVNAPLFVSKSVIVIGTHEHNPSGWFHPRHFLNPHPYTTGTLANTEPLQSRCKWLKIIMFQSAEIGYSMILKRWSFWCESKAANFRVREKREAL